MYTNTQILHIEGYKYIISVTNIIIHNNMDIILYVIYRYKSNADYINSK